MRGLKNILRPERNNAPLTPEEARRAEMEQESYRQVSRNRKILLIIVLIAALIFAWYIKGHWTVPGDEVRTCVLTIECTQAYRSRDLLPSDIAKQIKKKGKISTNSIFVVDEGDTIQDLLESYGEKNNVEIVFEGTDIYSIKGLSNGDAGSGSRWDLMVNGEKITGSQAGYTIQHDDEIIVSYVIE